MKNKKQYIVPELTSVTFEVEQGFSGSIPYQQTSNLDLFPLSNETNYNSQAQRNWHQSNSGSNIFSWDN